MVNVVSAVSGTQGTPLRTDVQGGGGSSALSQPVSSGNVDFVVSGIHMDNLQNVAILEYRSSKTGEVITQYPNQSQIDAFKSAQRRTEQIQSAPQSSAPAAPSSGGGGQTVSVSAPVSSSSGGDSGGAAPSGGGSTGSTTSVVA
jgi:hypothetical protein